ncbi:hypothetical protein B2G67_04240 [Microbacterium foliorum]|nr:hypothetical protein B2G67_04240 [Microbacterium foliorum]
MRRAWENDIVARRIVPLEWVLSLECDTRDTAMLVKSTRVDILRNERLLTAMRAHDAALTAAIHTLLHLLCRGGQIPAQRVSERTAMGQAWCGRSPSYVVHCGEWTAWCCVERPRRRPAGFSACDAAARGPG